MNGKLILPGPFFDIYIHKGGEYEAKDKKGKSLARGDSAIQALIKAYEGAL